MRAASSATLLLLLLTATALADPSDADRAFKSGRDLMKAGKYTEACAQFEKSQELDPELGTEYNLAQCDEKLGKLAAALAIYRDIADHDTNGQRRSAAIDLAAQLDKRVPRVQLQLDPPTADATVKIGPLTVLCVRGRCDARLDRGHYDVVATAPGFRDATASLDVVGEGTTVIVKLVLVHASAPTREPSPPPVPVPVPVPAPESPPHSLRKPLAIGTIAVGGAAVVTGAVFGVLANSAWSDAKAACGADSACTDPTALAKANSLRDTANSRANLSTGFFIAGAAVAAAGIVLYLTAPSETALTVAPSGTGVTLSGAF